MNKIPKFEDLENGSIITIESGEKFIKTDNEYLSDLGDECNDTYFNDDESYDFKKDLIVKIEKPIIYETIFEKEEPKEMTVKEIADILGYDIKIVKEK